MKEELTDKMHSEFSLSEETDRRHTCFAVLDMISRGSSIKDSMVSTDVTMTDLHKHLSEFNKLFNKNVSLNTPEK